MLFFRPVTAPPQSKQIESHSHQPKKLTIFVCFLPPIEQLEHVCLLRLVDPPHQHGQAAHGIRAAGPGLQVRGARRLLVVGPRRRREARGGHHQVPGRHGRGGGGAAWAGVFVWDVLERWGDDLRAIW